MYTSIAIDSAGNLHISYYDYANEDLKYARRTSTGWQTDTVDTGGDVGMYTAIAVDSADNPHISYFDITNTDLKYAKRTLSCWQTETIDKGGVVGYYPSIAIDPWYVYISYYDEICSRLKFATTNPNIPGFSVVVIPVIILVVSVVVIRKFKLSHV